MDALALLIKGAMLPLPKVKTSGYVFGLLNGAASLAYEAKEVPGHGFCEGVLGNGALAWSTFTLSELLLSELGGILLLGLGGLFCVSMLFTLLGHCPFVLL